MSTFLLYHNKHCLSSTFGDFRKFLVSKILSLKKQTSLYTLPMELIGVESVGFFVTSLYVSGGQIQRISQKILGASTQALKSDVKQAFLQVCAVLCYCTKYVFCAIMGWLLVVLMSGGRSDRSVRRSEVGCLRHIARIYTASRLWRSGRSCAMVGQLLWTSADSISNQQVRRSL